MFARQVVSPLVERVFVTMRTVAWWQHGLCGFFQKLIDVFHVLCGVTVVVQTPQKTPIRWCSGEHCPVFLALHLGNSQPLPRGADFGWPPLTWALARQSSSDVVNAPAPETTRTFSVSFTFLASTFVAASALGRGKDSPAVLDLQAVQMSVLTLHDLVASCSTATHLTVQMSHSHRSRDTSNGCW